MECPHCAQETDPTLLYCKFCGEQMDLDPAAIHKALERDAERDAIEIMALQARSAIYVAAFLFVCILALRVVLLRPVVADVSPGYFAPLRLVEEKNVEPPPALEVEPAPIDIPDDKQREEYHRKKK